MAELGDIAQKVGGETIELAIPLPQAPTTKIHLRLTHSSTSLLLFLSTVENGDLSLKPALGSFVYALPDVSLV